MKILLKNEVEFGEEVRRLESELHAKQLDLEASRKREFQERAEKEESLKRESLERAEKDRLAELLKKAGIDPDENRSK